MSKDSIKEAVLEANIKAYNTKNVDEFEDFQKSAIYYRNSVLSKNVQNILKMSSSKRPRILEIGCGTGFMTEFFFKFSKGKVYCLDIAQKSLDILKSKLSNDEIKRAKFICSDAFEYLRKTKDKFDIVAVHGALHHMVDYMDLCDEIIKHLNKGGIFYITNEPAPPRYYNHYWTNFFTNLDIAYSKHLHKNNKKFIAYLLFAPVNFLKPLINNTPIKKIKDKYFHKRTYDDLVLSEYWEEPGLDINELINKFKKSRMRIIKLGFFTIHRTMFIIKLSRHFRVNRFFTLIGKRI